MAEKQPEGMAGKWDSPYARVGVLFGAIIVVIGLIAIVSTVARSLSVNEKQLAEALIATLKEPRINGEISIAQQAQTNTFDAKATFSIEKMKRISVDGRLGGTVETSQLDLPFKAYGDLEKSDVFLRISNGPKVVEAFAANAPTLKSELESISNKINDKWLRVDQSDNKANKCTAELAEKLSNDTRAASETASTYMKHRFIRVEKREQKGGATAEYTVTTDPKAAARFMKTLKTRDFYTSLKSCDESFDPLGLEAADASQVQQRDSRTVTNKIVVHDGRITSFVSVTSVSQQVNTMRVSFNFKKGEEIIAPTEGIVEYSIIQDEMASLGNMFQTQLQQQQMNQYPGLR